jgi:hypothetical protein
MMRKYKNFSRIYTVDFSVWRYLINVVFTKNLQGAADELGLGNHGLNDNTEAAAIHEEESAVTHVLLHPDADEAAVAHESWHAIRRMLTYCGAETENETVAYHLGFLVGAITKMKKKRQF